MPRKIRGIDYKCLVRTYGMKQCAPFCGAGRRYLQRGMELYRCGECWTVKTYLKDASKLPPAQVFHADNLTKTAVCREKEREQNLQPAVCSKFLFAVYTVCQFFAEN